MKKIISEFRDNAQTIERKLNQAMETAAYSVVAMANLIRCKEIIKKLPEGQEMLQRVKDDGVRMISDWQMKGGAALSYETKLSDTEAKIEMGSHMRIHLSGAASGLDTGLVMHDIFHESQHQKQFREGLGWPDTNNFEDYKVWQRFQEADAESFAMAMSHKYAKNGMPQAWNTCKKSNHRHIAKAIEAKEKEMGRDLGFDEVRAHAFEGWFANEVGWLVADYDQDAKDKWQSERKRHQHGLPDETPNSELTLKDFKKFNQVAGVDLIKDQNENAFRQKRYFADYHKKMTHADMAPKMPQNKQAQQSHASKIRKTMTPSLKPKSANFNQ